MTFVIHNYDSFPFNLVHYLMRGGQSRRNDTVTAVKAIRTDPVPRPL